jgi:outer membrane protein assembly factor BamA
VSVGYNYFNRFDLYLLNSLYLDFGYRWKSKTVFSHILNPIEISYTSVPESSKSDAFRDYLEQNPGVQRSFEDQLILGTGYDFTYNRGELRQNYLFFNGGIDFSGNLTSLLASTFNANRNADGEYTLLGIPFSQYVRFRTDLRYELRINQGSSIATRFVTGLGFPYGNSTVLPYIKQFFVGGTNSLRSFLARSVGPGSEPPPQGFTDLTGDMRLEANIEYRFSFSNRLKGALFMDAGNIWLIKTDPNRPNATFKWPGWISEVAISTGWGLRWDFEYIVARLDFGYTLRTPYFPEGQRWAKEINFLDPTFNFAIGYPF